MTFEATHTAYEAYIQTRKIIIWCKISFISVIQLKIITKA